MPISAYMSAAATNTSNPAESLSEQVTLPFPVIFRFVIVNPRFAVPSPLWVAVIPTLNVPDTCSSIVMLKLMDKESLTRPTPNILASPRGISDNELLERVCSDFMLQFPPRPTDALSPFSE